MALLTNQAYLDYLLSINAHSYLTLITPCPLFNAYFLLNSLPTHWHNFFK